MPQRWIDNWQTETTLAMGVNDTPLINDLVPDDKMSLLQSALQDGIAWVELVLLGEDGVHEVIRASNYSPIQRDLTGIGELFSWPAGTKICASLSASIVDRLYRLTRPTTHSVADSFALQDAVAGVVWEPAATNPEIVIEVTIPSGSDIESVNAEVLLYPPTPATSFVLNIRDCPQRVKLPAGAIGVYAPEEYTYQVTLPAAGMYRIRVQGVGELTLEISDFSEYTAIY